MKSFWKFTAILVSSLLVWLLLSMTQPETGLTTDQTLGTIAQTSSPTSPSSPLSPSSPTSPSPTDRMASSRQDICALVRAMPDAKNTDQFLTKVRVSREQVLLNLDQLKGLMEQIDAEGYGWQNVIGKPDAIPKAQLRAWILGALRMACDP